LNEQGGNTYTIQGLLTLGFFIFRATHPARTRLPFSALIPQTGSAVSESQDQGTVELQSTGVKQSLLDKINPIKLFRKINPDNLVKEGRVMTERRSYAQAQVLFQQALDLNPNFIPAFIGLGEMLASRGGRSNLEAANKNYQEAIKRNPFEVETYAATARIYDRLGQKKEATLERKKLVVVKTLEVDPRNAIANNNMGILLLQQGQTDVALTYFQKAISANQQYDVALRNLASTYLRMAFAEKSNEEAKNQLIAKAKVPAQKAISLSNTPSNVVVYGRVILAEGNTEEGLKLAERVLGADAGHLDALFLKKSALEAMARFEEAAEVAKTITIMRQGIAEGAMEGEA